MMFPGIENVRVARTDGHAQVHRRVISDCVGGDAVTEELDIVPQKVVVHRHIHRTYTCKQCEGLSDES